jgi:hypothetical protein
MNLKEKIEYCQMVLRSGMLPKGIASAEAVLVLIETGDELGLQPMQAIRSINVTQGKLMLGADIAVALCLKNPKCDYFICTCSDERSCTFETSREGKIQSLTYSIEQAKKAGLAGREMWQKYPAEMLRARAKISLARLVFSDVLAGVYTEDEVSSQVSSPVADAPVVVEAPVRQVQSQTPPQQAKKASPQKQQTTTAAQAAPAEKADVATVVASSAEAKQPDVSAEIEVAVAAVKEVFQDATVSVSAASAPAPVKKNRVPSPVGDDLTDEEAIEEYTSWIDQIENAAQLDQLLFRLKFEEERENVKAAIRPVFKAKSDYFKQQEKAKKEAAQASAAPFRSESDDEVVGN